MKVCIYIVIVVVVVQDDLEPCLSVLCQSNEVSDSDSEDGCEAIIPLTRDRMEVAIGCIHACER